MREERERESAWSICHRLAFDSISLVHISSFHNYIIITIQSIYQLPTNNPTTYQLSTNYRSTAYLIYSDLLQPQCDHDPPRCTAPAITLHLLQPLLYSCLDTANCWLYRFYCHLHCLYCLFGLVGRGLLLLLNSAIYSTSFSHSTFYLSMFPDPSFTCNFLHNFTSSILPLLHNPPAPSTPYPNTHREFTVKH